MSNLELDIYTFSFELFITTYRLIFKLPKQELYEWEAKSGEPPTQLIQIL